MTSVPGAYARRPSRASPLCATLGQVWAPSVKQRPCARTASFRDRSAHQDGDDREEDDAGRTRRCRRLPREDGAKSPVGPPRARSDAVRCVHGAGSRLRQGEGRLDARGPRRAGARGCGRPGGARLHGCIHARWRRSLHRQLSHVALILLCGGRRDGLPHRRQLGRRVAEPAVPGARPAGQALSCIAAGSTSRPPPCGFTSSR